MLPVITSWQQGVWIAVDILLVALLIYQVLVMIRGTRAVPMLVGLTVVGAAGGIRRDVLRPAVPRRGGDPAGRGHSLGTTR